ncbi:MAG: hypothetical protein OXU37_03120 [Thaumarchaeota archaeon]|nr:hypothetical protein [Nitrososphaerota archaeon]
MRLLGGEAHECCGVSGRAYDMLPAAPSKGRHFHGHARDKCNFAMAH